MMRKTIAFLLLLGLLFVMLPGGLIVLVKVAPMHPGAPLYGVQSFAERLSLRLARDEVRRTERALFLAERRLVDLAQTKHPNRIEAAFDAFEAALDETIVRLDAVEGAEQERLLAEFNVFLIKADLVLQAFESKGVDRALALHRKIDALRGVDTPAALSEVVRTQDELSGAVPIPFLSHTPLNSSQYYCHPCAGRDNSQS